MFVGAWGLVAWQYTMLVALAEGSWLFQNPFFDSKLAKRVLGYGWHFLIARAQVQVQVFSLCCTNFHATGLLWPKRIPHRVRPALYYIYNTEITSVERHYSGHNISCLSSPVIWWFINIQHESESYIVVSLPGGLSSQIPLGLSCERSEPQSEGLAKITIVRHHALELNSILRTPATLESSIFVRGNRRCVVLKKDDEGCLETLGHE